MSVECKSSTLCKNEQEWSWTTKSWFDILCFFPIIFCPFLYLHMFIQYRFCLCSLIGLKCFFIYSYLFFSPNNWQNISDLSFVMFLLLKTFCVAPSCLDQRGFYFVEQFVCHFPFRSFEACLKFNLFRWHFVHAELLLSATSHHSVSFMSIFSLKNEDKVSVSLKSEYIWSLCF